MQLKKNLTMKSIFLCSLIALFAIVNCDDHYSSKFENIDIDGIIKNERILQNYLNCLLEEKGCTPEADELKSKYFENIQISVITFYSFMISKMHGK